MRPCTDAAKGADPSFGMQLVGPLIIFLHDYVLECKTSQKPTPN